MITSARMMLVVLSFVLCLAPSVAIAQKKPDKDVPMAPLPIQIRMAKKVFIANGGGSDRGYDIFYADMKDWAKYELVNSPDEAELVMEISYRNEDGGTRVWSATNTYTKATQVYSSAITWRFLVLTIYDRKSQTVLWSTRNYPKGAYREKNREKEFYKAVHALVEALRKRMNVQD